LVRGVFDLICDIVSEAYLLFQNLLKLLLSGIAIEVLPRKLAQVEVQYDVPYSFQVISSALLQTDVRVDARVPRSTDHALILSHLDMVPILVEVQFRKSEIDHVDAVLVSS
jgi:hypothetical protein